MFFNLRGGWAGEIDPNGLVKASMNGPDRAYTEGYLPYPCVKSQGMLYPATGGRALAFWELVEVDQGHRIA